ncbi:uncharacterized protein PHALS_06152 [Plasmopara halstedii]|uniref:Uncharacterized protein n=1 Tax=Plasmopara halstedii TaxID=4781 RepID=A0A0P1B2F8_PLAHL|nr:uncharacterized protein PHALS_06152 [Plasmopara halstedii]CEG48325.1 hypothetical protein PHALS_06152 [Plasmopara halstedii]|eukprot:XP_024584694.1 hypothetical protein PHALS_06152 [Plasmopara halstedii]
MLQRFCPPADMAACRAGICDRLSSITHLVAIIDSITGEDNLRSTIFDAPS